MRVLFFHVLYLMNCVFLTSAFIQVEFIPFNHTVLRPVIDFNRLKESILQIVMVKSFKTVHMLAIIVRQQIEIDA